MAPDKPANQLFATQYSRAGYLLQQQEQVWQAIPAIEDYIAPLIEQLPPSYQERQPGVWVGPDTEIAPTALIEGPGIIGSGCQIRHNAFIRGRIICGDQVVIGNTTEVKNAILFDRVQLPHFNYVGDAILGYRAHLGAGAVVSNFKSQGDEVHVYWQGQKIRSGLQKLGALLGDYAEIGCNAVLNPGTIIGRRSIIYPLVSVRGNIPADTIVKGDGQHYPRR